jgi:hypothetical protein
LHTRIILLNFAEKNMEKVKSCALQKEGKKKDGSEYKIFAVETESGKTGQSFEELAVGDEVEMKEGEYNGKPQYTFFKPKAKKPFPMKDYKFEKRKAALEAAVAIGKEKSSADILKVADYFLKWLES